MHAIFAATGLLAASLVGGVPVAKRQQMDEAAITDVQILNYALTLEHLEDTFYQQGLQNFTQEQFAAAGFNETFYNNLKKISMDETTHVNFITTALQSVNATPVEACQYNFGFADVTTFLATAAILEGVGVTAYLGAAAYIMDKMYLTAAGTILTVEARHTSYLRSQMGQVPFPQPFDTPLSFNEVYSLASPFIASCPPSNPPLPVKAFPPLTVSAGMGGSITSGSTITVQTPGYTLEPPQGGEIYGAFIAVTGPTFVAATAVDGGYSLTVPQGFTGQSYVVLTACNTSITDDDVAAGPAIIEINES